MDTSHHAAPAPAPVEGDGISYSGLIWFMVVIAITTIGCQLLMWVLLKAFQASAATVATAPLAVTVPAGERQAPGGRVYPDMHAIGLPNGPEPRLLVDEPANLDTLRKHEHQMLTTYGWMDQNAGIVRLPIQRAKELILERGLPVRGAEPARDAKIAQKDVKK
jgi:hypothetical protein